MPTSNKSPTLITTGNEKPHVTVNSFLTMKKRKRFQPMTCIANANKKESNKEQFTFSIYFFFVVKVHRHHPLFAAIGVKNGGKIDDAWLLKSVDMGQGGGKSLEKRLTSFIDGPFAFRSTDLT